MSASRAAASADIFFYGACEWRRRVPLPAHRPEAPTEHPYRVIHARSQTLTLLVKTTVTPIIYIIEGHLRK